MKIRSAHNRDDLQINKKDNVVEIGSRHNLSFRTNTIIYIDILVNPAKEKYLRYFTKSCYPTM